MTETPVIERRNRRKSDRVLMGLTIATAVLAILAIAAAIALARIEFIQARHGNCELLGQIVIAATPPGNQARAQAFINSTPLRNCDRYAGSFIP